MPMPSDCARPGTREAPATPPRRPGGDERTSLVRTDWATRPAPARRTPAGRGAHGTSIAVRPAEAAAWAQAPSRRRRRPSQATRARPTGRRAEAAGDGYTRHTPALRLYRRRRAA